HSKRVSTTSDDDVRLYAKSAGALEHALIPEGNQAQPASPVSQTLSRRRRFLFVGTILGTIFVIQEAVCRFLFPVPEVLFNRADYMPNLFSSEITYKPLCNVVVRWEFEPDGVSF